MCECNCNCTNCSPTNFNKWKYSMITALIALVVFSPLMYSIMQMILGKIVTISKKGCPTMMGLVLHLVVFTVLLRYSMELRL